MPKLLLPSLLLTLALVGCARSSESESESTATPTATVRTQALTGVAMKATLEAFGSTGFPPEHQHSINASAELRVGKVLVSAGESVRAGQSLLLATATANSRLELTRARNELQFSEQELARVSALRQQQLATNAELAAARQGHDNARAALASIVVRLGNRNGEIRAENEGLVASVDVQQGDIVAAGAPLLHLADRAGLRVRLGIEPTDFVRVKEGQSVAVTSVYDAHITTRGRVVKLVKLVDPQTRLAEALIDVEPVDGLLPGSAVRAAIELQDRPQVLAVALAAVLYEGTRPYVYLIEKEKARRTWVTLGQVNDDRIEILSGAKAGDQVVVEGNYELEDGMAVKRAATAP